MQTTAVPSYASNSNPDIAQIHKEWQQQFRKVPNMSDYLHWVKGRRPSKRGADHAAAGAPRVPQGMWKECARVHTGM